MTPARIVAALLRTEPVPDSGAHCVRCKRWTYAPIPVGYIERVSGPGFTQYACPSHATAMISRPTPGELEPDA
ncbi:hypothetical protein ACFQ67_27405 [Streptomyces sp. NPDC056488]|uniref:hypothetical protein n=1 Tax=Streptomyces sp. NPDC056488 TaxID=3345836 RepID=UPI003692E6F6